MVWLNLLILVLASSLSNSETPSERYLLVYAIENKGFLKFVEMDLDFKGSKTLLNIKTNNRRFDKMHLGYSEDGAIIYWTYSNSNILGRIEVNTGIPKQKCLDKRLGTFLGAGNDDKIYFYNSDNKTFTVHDYEHNKNELQFVISEDTDMHCVDIDPLNREQIFFAVCGESYDMFGKVLDIKEKKVLDNYKPQLPDCFDTWKISPNGKKAFAEKSHTIYESPEAGHPFYYYGLDDVQEFAVGNNELFYTSASSGGKTITKLIQSNLETSTFIAEATVNALLLYRDIPPKRDYLIYAIENGTFLEFVKTDLDFRKSKTLLRVDTRGQMLDKMHLGYSDNGDILYWSYAYNSFIGRLEVATGKDEQRYLSKELGTFLGAGNNDRIYFYLKSDKTLTVYDFKNNIHELQLVISDETDMHCADVNPLNREQLLFAECLRNGTNLAKILDVKKKKVFDDDAYNLKLKFCFKTWKISPNGKTVYAFYGTSISRSTVEHPAFLHYIHLYEDVDIVAGNNDLFYIRKAGGNKIFKLAQPNAKKQVFDVQGNVKALVVHQEQP